MTIFFNGLPLFAPGRFDRSSRFGNSYNPNPEPGDTLFLRRVVREIAFKGPKSLGSLFVRAVIAILVVVVVVGGALLLPLVQGSNAATFGAAPWSERIITVGFQSIIAHTAGPSTIDFGALCDEAALVIMQPMFIGAGAASTAGGTKVATNENPLQNDDFDNRW